MRLRTARKILKDEFSYRCRCDGPWGFHKKSTIAEAQRLVARRDRRVWFGLDRMVAPADDWLAQAMKFPETPNDFRAAILDGIRVARCQAGLDDDRELNALRAALRDPGRPAVMVFAASPGGTDFVDLTTLLSPEHLELLHSAARDSGFGISGIVKDPEKP